MDRIYANEFSGTISNDGNFVYLSLKHKQPVMENGFQIGEEVASETTITMTTQLAEVMLREMGNMIDKALKEEESHVVHI